MRPFLLLVIGLTLFACGGESARQNNGRPASAGTGGGTGASGGAAGTTGRSGGPSGDSGAPGGSGGAPGGSGGTSGSSAGSGALGSAGTQDGSIGGTAGVGLGDASCKDPRPIVGIDGKATGFVSCSAGFIHRPERRDCPSSLPRPDPIQYPPDATVECTRDQDCTKLRHGHCILWRYPVVSHFATMCVAGCVRDAECGAGSICACADPVGACVAASCATDADCGNGRFCVTTGSPAAEQVPQSSSFACQSPNDSCRGTQDCTAPQMVCVLIDGGRTCVPDYPTE